MLKRFLKTALFMVTLVSANPAFAFSAGFSPGACGTGCMAERMSPGLRAFQPLPIYPSYQNTWNPYTVAAPIGYYPRSVWNGAPYSSYDGGYMGSSMGMWSSPYYSPGISSGFAY